MTRIMILELVCLAILAAELQAVEKTQPERAFVRALELFDAAQSPADYREAAAVLESMLDGGMKCGAVYYNLGNTWFRAGEYGRAILNYRKAKPFRPRDPYLIANLDQALATAPGHLSDPPKPWWSHVLFWNEWISYPQKLQMFFLGWSVMACVVTAVVIFRIPRATLPMAGSLMLLVLLGVDCWLSDQQVNHSRRAVITGETIARKGIGDSYEAAFDQPLKDGAEFVILGVTSDWTFGHFEGIGDGWVRNQFVAR